MNDLREYVVQTEQGRNVSYMAHSKDEARENASNHGHHIKRVLNMDEWERERDFIILEWRYKHNKHIEEESA